MKKIFRNTLVALAFLGTGTGLTSCDSETITSLLPVLLELLMGGQAQTYSGTAQLEGLESTGETDKDGNVILKYMDTDSIKTATITATVQVSNNAATITIPELKVGGRTLTNIQVAGIGITNGVLEGGYQWAYTCTRQYGTTSESISVVADGTANDNSKTYHFDLLSGKVVTNSDNSATFTFEACVYMGTEAYNITYNGALVQQ